MADQTEGLKLHSLIPLTDFMAILGIDDREEALARYCLLTATYSIEQYCKRRLLRKKHHELLPFQGDYTFPLREYQVWEVLAVFQAESFRASVLLEPDFYHTVPDCGTFEDWPYSLALTPALRLIRGASVIKVIYRAGYPLGKVQVDLASTCLELAAWNMSRYRGRRVGLTGAVREGVRIFI